MPILEVEKDRAAIRRVLLAAGMGAVFGFQNWQLAKYGFGVSIPWYGVAWLVLGHTLLGAGIGATAGWKASWNRGFVFGLTFSIPSAVLASLLGVKWAPYGIAIVTVGLVVGVLIAVIADSVFPSTREPTGQPQVSGRTLSAGIARSAKVRSNAIRQRLAEEKSCLEHLDAERAHQGDSGFGKTTEERIIWGELLELELQDIDEQVSRIAQAADNALGPGARPSNDTRTPPRNNGAL